MKSGIKIPSQKLLGINNELKTWREIARPHKDVLEGSFQQSEFAADITAVATGQAPQEYQDAESFSLELLLPKV